MTRFCIICNYISRLIPPIASRCAKFRFKPLPHDAMIGRLQYICEQERVVHPTGFAWVATAFAAEAACLRLSAPSPQRAFSCPSLPRCADEQLVRTLRQRGQEKTRCSGGAILS